MAVAGPIAGRRRRRDLGSQPSTEQLKHPRGIWEHLIREL